MINNFEQISKLLKWESEDDFYFVQIIQRKKDNPGNIHGSNNSSRIIKAYYITSLENLELQKEEMIFLADKFNARIGISLNRRSFYKTAFETLKIIADQMHNKSFKEVRKAYNRACGIHNGDSDKVWLLDVDKITDPELLAMFDYPEERREYFMRDLIAKAMPIGEDKILAKVPSKSGYHLLTKPFDSREFIKQLPEVSLHKNNPTNLYIP